MNTGFLSKTPFGPLAWLASLLLASGLSWLIAPMQSPDEHSHIDRAYLISQGTFLLQKMPPDLDLSSNNQVTADVMARARQVDGRMGGMVDRALLDFQNAYLNLARRSDARLAPAELDRLAQLRWSGEQQYDFLPGTGYYFPAIYAPQALGLAVGRWGGLRVQQSYYLVRALTLASCFALLWLAFTIATPNAAVLAVLLLPMSLFQMLSPTIDGLCNALSVLAMTLFVVCTDTQRKHHGRAFLGLVVCIFILATSRTHLVPMITLPFFLAWQRRSLRELVVGSLLAVSVMGWVLFAIGSTHDPRVIGSQVTRTLLLHYAAHPMAFFDIVLASLKNDALGAFYRDSFIGILGWLDTRLPPLSYRLLWIGLALCVLTSVSVSRIRLEWQPRLLLAALAVISAVLVFLALLVTWTPHPATVVTGVQGRYFAIPAIILGFAVSDLTQPASYRYRRFDAPAVAGLALVSLGTLALTLLGRYH